MVNFTKQAETKVLHSPDAKILLRQMTNILQINQKVTLQWKYENISDAEKIEIHK